MVHTAFLLPGYLLALPTSASFEQSFSNLSPGFASSHSFWDHNFTSSHHFAPFLPPLPLSLSDFQFVNPSSSSWSGLLAIFLFLFPSGWTTL